MWEGMMRLSEEIRQYSQRGALSRTTTFDWSDRIRALEAEVERMKPVLEAAMKAKVHPNEALVAAVREARGEGGTG